MERAIELFPLAQELTVVAIVELCGGVEVVEAAELAKDGLAAVGIDCNVCEASLGGEPVVADVGNARLGLCGVPEGDEHIVATQLLQRECGVLIGHGEVGCHAAHCRLGGTVVTRSCE